MAVAVADTHGTLVYYEKMDNTELASARIALDKASASATFMRPTRALADLIAEERFT
jgi:glc operon protein GlcG